MTKEIVNAINITLDAYSIIVSLIIAGSIFLFKKVDKSAKWFAYTNIAAIIYGISDIFMWISEGTDAAWKFVALPVSSFVFFLVGIILFVCYIEYIINYFRQTTTISKKYTYFCIAMAAIYIAFLLITPFTDGIYVISEQNTYSRGKFFLVTVFVELVIYLEALQLIFKYHKQAQRFEVIGFASFIFVPFICQIIQIANFGIALNSFGLSISFMIIFINLNQKMQHTLEATQNEMNQREYDNLKRQHKTIYYFTSLIEERDLGNAGHEIRLAKIVEHFAKKCAQAEIHPDLLTEKFINRLVEAVPFHDVGKIKLPEEILKKPGKYTYSEMEIMQKHTEYGADISKAILSVSYGPEFTNFVYDLCKYHHEKWNGRGYPENLKGSDIPLCARFMAIVDAFDAMVNYRSYKKAISYDEAFDIIKKEAGEQFDPVLAQEFILNRKKIIEINEEYKDNMIEG